MQWEKDKKKKDDKTLREVEEALELHYNSEGFGYLIEEHKLEVKLLEDKKRQILLEKEKEWRLKIKLYGSRQEMITPSFFIDMKIAGKTLIQYGK
jgi:hypothetical protein